MYAVVEMGIAIRSFRNQVDLQLLCLLGDTEMAFVVIVLSDEPRQNQGRGLVDHKLVKAPPPPPLPVILLLAVPRRLFCFGALVILDVVCRYLSLFLLYI